MKQSLHQPGCKCATNSNGNTTEEGWGSPRKFPDRGIVFYRCSLVLEKPLRVPWIAGRSSQSILKEINSEYSLEGLMLKLQYFGHLMQRADSLEKTLILGKTEDQRRRGWQRIRWFSSITDSMDINLSKLWDSREQRSLACCSPWGRKVRHDLATDLQRRCLRVVSFHRLSRPADSARPSRDMRFLGISRTG